MTSTHLIASLAGLSPGSPVLAAYGARDRVAHLSDAAHDAVLRPRDPGGLPHAARAALAVRMAEHLRDPALQAHYALLLGASGDPETAALAEPGRLPADPRLAAIARHVDLLTLEPRRATRDAITALVEAGVTEPDIVRISELAAFVNYQARVVAGLRLIEETAR